MFGLFLDTDGDAMLKAVGFSRAQIHFHIASVYRVVKKLQLARHHVEKCLEMVAHPVEASNALTLKADILECEGLYEEAIETASMAIRVRDECGFPLDPQTYVVKAESYYALGELDRAVEVLQSTVTLLRCNQQGAEERRELAAVLLRCGSKLSEMGRSAEAMSCFEEAAAADRSELNRMRVDEARGSHIMLKLEGKEFDDVTQYEHADHASLVREGTKCFENALSLAVALDDEYAQQGISLNFACFLNAARTPENRRRASSIFGDALDLARKLHISGPVLANTLFHCGLSLWLNSPLGANQGTAILQEALTLYESMWASLKEDRSMIAIGNKDTERLYVFLSFAHLQDGDISDALEVLERGRSRALAVELDAKRRGRRSVPADKANLTAVVNSPKVEEMQAYAKSIHTTFIYYHVLSEKLIISWVISEALEKPAYFNSIDDESYAVEISALADIVHMSVNQTRKETRDSETFHFLDSATDVETRTRFFQPDEKTFSEETAAASNATLLYAKLWRPVQSLVPEDRPVVIIPQGALWKTPFCLLVDDDMRPLVDRHTVSYAPSIGVLKLANDLAATAKTKDLPALVVGNPKMPVFQGAERQFISLPGAELEAEDVATLLATRKLSGIEATKQAVLERIERCTIVHFATHGFLHAPVIDESASGYLTGGIVLSSDPDVNATSSSCLLVSEEIQKLNLSGMKLAFLSCCHTGDGVVKPEGLLGLGRAFMFAGCQCVVLARWAIPDNATRLLVQEFYKAFLISSDAPSALRQAQRARRDAGSTVREWAGFYVLGASRKH